MIDNESSAEINPLLIPLLATLETGINQLIAMDPDTFKSLRRFEGKIIALQITDIEQTLYLFPDSQGIQLMSHYEGEADTMISGSSLAFAKMALADEKDQTATVFKGGINITGDVALGQKFQNVLQRLDIDWEEHLSHITGDVIAHSLGNIARGLNQWGKQAIKTISMDLSEFVQFESRDIASVPEVQNFNAQVDHLRHQVDRAQARLERIDKLISSQNKK